MNNLQSPTERRTPNPISISIAPLNRLVGRMYYDLVNTVEIMHELFNAGVVDGFEFQNLAEWDARTPPCDEGARRFTAWEASERHIVTQLAETLKASNLPITSIHANRDVGMCLCSGQVDGTLRGKLLMQESMWLAEQVGANICVFHLWDTWKEDFDPVLLVEAVHKVTQQFPNVKAAIENVPTHLTGYTPYDLLQAYDWITLDVRWAALFDQLHAFVALKDRIANVHLSGQLDGDRWAVDPRWYSQARHVIDFDGVVDILIDQWRYAGPLTVEINRTDEGTWENLIAAMKNLRRHYEKS